MPQTEVVFYQERRGEVPVLDWLAGLRRSNEKAYAKSVAAIESLAEHGYDLRRPLADFLRDGIHELRVKKGTVNFRILYFFHGRTVAVLGHAITKEDKVPAADIERCLRRKKAFEADPASHTYSEDRGG